MLPRTADSAESSAQKKGPAWWAPGTALGPASLSGCSPRVASAAG